MLHWMYDLVLVGGKHFTLISDIGHYFTGAGAKAWLTISQQGQMTPVQIFTFNYKVMRIERG